MDDSVKSTLHRWVIFHTHVIQSPIANVYIKVNLVSLNGGPKTKQLQKVFLHVSIREIYKRILRKDDTGFSM